MMVLDIIIFILDGKEGEEEINSVIEEFCALIHKKWKIGSSRLCTRKSYIISYNKALWLDFSMFRKDQTSRKLRKNGVKLLDSSP